MTLKKPGPSKRVPKVRNKQVKKIRDPNKRFLQSPVEDDTRSAFAQMARRRKNRRRGQVW